MSTILIAALLVLQQRDEIPSTPLSPLAFASADISLIMHVNLPDVLSHESLAPVAKELTGYVAELAVDLDNVQSWTVQGRGSSLGGGPLQIISFKTPRDVERVRQRLVGIELEDRTYKGQQYQVQKASFHIGPGKCAFSPDQKTLVIADSEASLKKALDAGAAGKAPEEFRGQWRTVSKSPAAVLINLDLFPDESRRSTSKSPELLKRLSPIWTKSGFATFSLDTLGSPRIVAKTTAQSEADAKLIATALEFGKSLASPALLKQVEYLENRLQDSRPGKNRDDRTLEAALLNLLATVLSNGTVQVVGNDVSATIVGNNGDVRATAVKIKPALRRQWWWMVRGNHVVNLRRISLALMKYHEKYKAYPPSAQLGKDGTGTHPVSWRVLILPFLGHQKIYDDYHFDEAWDSPHNTKATARIPDVYADPHGTAGSIHSCYYGIVGPDSATTCFRERTGVARGEMVDGTENAIQVVETKRAIHWAKPEDIRYVPDGAVPVFDGLAHEGFRVIMASGKIRFIATKDINRELLFEYFTIKRRDNLDESMFSEEAFPDGLPTSKPTWR